jgi:hypothetical protein
LIVDPNAVLSCPVTAKLFEAIAGWLTKVYEARSLLQTIQSDISASLGNAPQTSRSLTVGEPLGIAITESGA